jgi:RNA polymerase sigma-70 factor (ECF subfamily)
MGIAATHDDALLAAARAGDDDAYGRLVSAHRGELHAHCYRMLGSVQDAEDAFQEAMIRAWRALPKFERRSSLRSWLYRIATNACLDSIGKRSKQRVLPIDYGPPGDPHAGPGPPLVESVWVEPYPDAHLGLADGRAAPDARYELRESVELAFIAALQLLPPRQRAVLICREVLGFSAAEVAETLDTTVASVNSALQRARKAIEEKLPDRSQQETLRAIGDEHVRALVETYVDAWQRGDVEAIVSMLAEDAVIAMPPMASWFRGDGVRVFLTEWAFSGRLYNAEGRRRVRVIPTQANGQPAFGTYRWDPDEECYLPAVIQVLTLDAGRIAEITGFVDPAPFARFGLPDRLPAD